MKKLLSTIVLSSLLCITCSAQFNVYHPFPDSNAIWGEELGDGSCGCGGTTYVYNFVVNGDTVVNGKTYHKVYKNDGYIIQDCTCFGPYAVLWEGSTNFFGAYREDTLKHIYACCTSDLGTQDSLLYDFTLKVGDTLRQYNSHSNFSPQPYTVNSIDSVLVSGSYRKRFNLKINNDTMIGRIPSIIEGIGSTQGLFDLMCDPFEIASQLDCFSQNRKTLWSYFPNDSCDLYYLGTPTMKQPPVNISIYPNPANGIFNIEVKSEGVIDKSIVEVYNVLGQQVHSQAIVNSSSFIVDLSSQPNGIYFYRVVDENSNLIGEGKLIIQK